MSSFYYETGQFYFTFLKMTYLCLFTIFFFINLSLSVFLSFFVCFTFFSVNIFNRLIIFVNKNSSALIWQMFYLLTLFMVLLIYFFICKFFIFM